MLYERQTKKPVSLISINGSLVKIQIIKKLDPKKNIIINEFPAESRPISYQSIEQSVNEAIFVKQSEIENNLKKKTQNLDFYNNYLNDTKSLIFHKTDANYK